MYFLDPDILDLSRQLSPAINIGAILIGLFLWVMGAYSHRFWLALAVTVAAGVVGMFAGPEFSVQPLVAALLLALSAGVLALSLARVGLFLAGGLAAVLFLRATTLEWNEFVGFLVGGLLGVWLYQLWVMALSALVGTILTSYAILSLLDVWGRLDAVEFATKNAPFLNWGVASGAVLGMAIQFVWERRRQSNAALGKGAKRKKKDEPAPEYTPQPIRPPAPAKSRWWDTAVNWIRERAA